MEANDKGTSTLLETYQNPMLPLPYRVRKVQKETRDTFTLELAPSNAHKTVAFKPGQFNMIYVFGTGEVPISICGDPAQPDVIKHTTRMVGTVTQAMHRLKEGAMLGIRGPFGSGWPLEKAKGRDVVIVAGGIGLAPLRPAIYQILAERDQYKKVVLLYGARTPEEILYKHELREWKSRSDLEVHITVDRATGSWKGSVGVVPNLIGGVPFDPSNVIAMVCGPEIMMKFTVLGFQNHGVADERIFISMERNMKCAVGFCGHCQYGPHFICKDGPVFSFDQVRSIFSVREV